MNLKRAGLLTTAVLAAICTLRAADPPSGPESTKSDSRAELRQLRELLVKQQEQIEALRRAVAEQQKMLDAMEEKSATVASASQNATAPDRLVASGTPMAVPPPQSPSPTPQRTSAFGPVTNANSNNPLQIQLGNISIVPIGFMDATAVWRNVNAGSGIGSNFGSIPYNNAVPAGKVSEFRFSPQNSRLGFRVDGNWKGAHFIAYNEFDFLGTAGTNNIGVTNGAFVPRMRLYWVDVAKGKFEFLAGQSWSMLTPNRNGISALPGDLFSGQVMDVNYIVGLTWTRQPGVRFLYHPSGKATLGLSFENPNQYAGGYGGATTIVAPTALASVVGSQLDTGSAGYLSTPNVHPDIIAKVALDPSPYAHIEFAGIERTFRVVNPNTLQTFTNAGGGASINANFRIYKGVRLITNNYWSDGGGRYLFGQAPDVIVRADGGLSPVHAGGTIQGFEATLNSKVQLWGYYGGVYIGRNVAIDRNGKPVGWGFTGSSNGQNRTVQEATFGLTHTAWKDPRFGALTFIYQYAYETRNSWFVALGQPSKAHDDSIYFNIRYTLPGAPPMER